MNKLKTIISVAMLSLAATTAVAQELESGYFTDGFNYRHTLNPAFGNEHGYFAMPALGNFNVEVRGSLGLQNLLYNVNGRTVTFLHPSVSAAEFLGSIGDENKMGMNMKMQILGAGFKGFGGYNTFEVNVRADINSVIPNTLFQAMKEGLTNKSYDFDGMGLNARAYAEIALGHSHQINEQLRVGAKVKVLVGAGNIETDFKKASLNLDQDKYTATVDAELRVNANEVVFEHDVNEHNDGTKHQYVSGVDDFTPGVAGLGFAVDLGAEYKLNDDWRFSAALLDLGFINYKNTFVASTGGEKSFTTSDYIFNVNDDASNNFDDELDKMTDDISSLYELGDKGNVGSNKVGLGTTMRLGAEYTFPMYRKLTFGLLNTTRMGKYSWTEFRLSANVAPVKFFSAGVNVNVGTFGTGLGAILNFHTGGLNLYVAMDRMLGSLSKQGVPLNSNGSLSIGLNF